jgi:hypothetical protein
MSTTQTPRPMANPRAEAHFVASGMADAFRPVVAAEAHYMMNIGVAGRYSDAVFMAIQGAKRNEWTSKVAKAMAAEVQA